MKNEVAHGISRVSSFFRGRSARRLNFAASRGPSQTVEGNEQIKRLKTGQCNVSSRSVISFLSSPKKSTGCSWLVHVSFAFQSPLRKLVSLYRGTPIGVFNPAIPSGIFPQSRNPEGFFRLITIPVMFS